MTRAMVSRLSARSKPERTRQRAPLSLLALAACVVAASAGRAHSQCTGYVRVPFVSQGEGTKLCWAASLRMVFQVPTLLDSSPLCQLLGRQLQGECCATPRGPTPGREVDGVVFGCRQHARWPDPTKHGLTCKVNDTGAWSFDTAAAQLFLGARCNPSPFITVWDDYDGARHATVVTGLKQTRSGNRYVLQVDPLAGLGLAATPIADGKKTGGEKIDYPSWFGVEHKLDVYAIRHAPPPLEVCKLPEDAP